MDPVNAYDVRSVAEMRGEDDAESAELQSMLNDARSYVGGFKWCHGIVEEFWGLGIGGIVSVFLFRILPEVGVDEWLWVISGDLPCAYIVLDSARSPLQALEIYCCLMEGWIRAVRSQSHIDEEFPVLATASLENATMLEKRIEFLRRDIISRCNDKPERKATLIS